MLRVVSQDGITNALEDFLEDEDEARKEIVVKYPTFLALTKSDMLTSVEQEFILAIASLFTTFKMLIAKFLRMMTKRVMSTAM